jgi:hypothetical protein
VSATPSVIDLIGHTPLVRLNRLSDETGCEILGKAEFMNPGGSIKDRAALSIVQTARASGALKPGGAIVEGTAGNTGIGLALVGAALGHPVVIVMPRTQSEEKKSAIRSLGARLVEVDAAPFSSPNHFVHYSGRLASELNESEEAGAIWANQFDNTANRDAHYTTTAPEIWEQTGGEVDAFGTPAQACWLLPSLSLAVWLPLRAVRALERRRNRIAEILDHLVIGLTAWFTVIHATLLWQGPVPRVTAIGLVGLLAWSALLLVIPRSAPPPPQRRRATDWGPHTWT